MRVLITSMVRLDVPSAARTRIRRIAKALSTAGHELLLIGSSGLSRVTGDCEVVIDDGLTLIRFNAARRSLFWSEALRSGAQAKRFLKGNLDNIIKKNSIDIVIDYSFQAQVSWAVVRSCKRCGVPVVADLVERYDWNWYHIINGQLLQQELLIRRVVPMMNGVVGISIPWCEWAESKRIPVVWIPSVAEDVKGAIRASPYVRRPMFNLVFAGHWLPREEPGSLIKGIAICRSRGLDVRLTVLGRVGTSYLERSGIKCLRSLSGSDRWAKFTGYVSDAERDRIFANADAFVLLRKKCRESNMLFPTRLPEYLLSGNPVIITEIENFSPIFAHKRDVWFLPHTNRPEDLADAIFALHADPLLRRDIGRSGRQTALREFCIEALGTRLSAFLKASLESAKNNAFDGHASWRSNAPRRVEQG